MKQCSRIDNWRVDLFNLAPDGDVSRIRISDISKARNPVLHNLVASYAKLVGAHAKINGNYKLAYIFENSAFTWGEGVRLLDKTFFGQGFYVWYRARIRGLRFIDCYDNDTYKSQRQFAEMGLPLNMNNWLLLRGALNKAKKTTKNRIRY